MPSTCRRLRASCSSIPSDLDTITSGPFLIDHDQKLQIQAGVYYDVLSTGLWFGKMSGTTPGSWPTSDRRISSATPTTPSRFRTSTSNHAGTGLDPNRIKARTIVDFQVGYDLQKVAIPVQLQFMVLNATNVLGLYNVLSTFGGTHVIPPRRFVGQAVVHF